MLSYPYHPSPLPLPYTTLPLSASSFNFCDPELYVDIFENVGRYGDGAGSNHITNSKDLNRLSGLEKITSDFVDSDEETDFMSKKKHKSNKVILW